MARADRGPGPVSEHAACCQALNRSHPEDVAQADGAEHGSMAQATEEGWAGKLQTHIGLFDRRFANGNGDDIRHDHHQSDFW